MLNSMPVTALWLSLNPHSPTRYILLLLSFSFWKMLSANLSEVIQLEHACCVTKSCLTICDPMDCSPPGSSVHEIFLARILEQVAISSSKGSSQPRDQTHASCVFCIGRKILYHQATTGIQISSYLQEWFPSCFFLALINFWHGC